MAKALGYYTYTGTTEVGAGETLPITNTIRQYATAFVWQTTPSLFVLPLALATLNPFAVTTPFQSTQL